MTESTHDQDEKEPQAAAAEKGSIDRRSFLTGSGAVAAATALHSQPTPIQASTGTVVEQGWQAITLQVNGKAVNVHVEPRTTLLEVLRYQLDLTGAKPVSADGSSGASTVMVDGKPKTASTLLAIACRKKSIQTIESLGGENPDEVAKAFVACDALQCGFCTPGFVVAVRAFLNKNPKATDEEIRQGLNGNICRCGTYNNIVKAATAIVKGVN
ncbi:MAG: (2Fe-2S)-binding protein [Planctomycetota bacterium]|nr:(2Fe-2S)-binding protein [Planctomycetota bacterium]